MSAGQSAEREPIAVEPIEMEPIAVEPLAVFTFAKYQQWCAAHNQTGDRESLGGYFGSLREALAAYLQMRVDPDLADYILLHYPAQLAAHAQVVSLCEINSLRIEVGVLQMRLDTTREALAARIDKVTAEVKHLGDRLEPSPGRSHGKM